ncbi:hypothetical protein V6N11_028567 [Hibiscus sabdariffa]|uniref:RNase H type-1 domain-containing protein n=1 Tax=Hibiscus sabdariffa TaxID=183260 RepID=A0ABR2A0D6_9ROSI
MSVFESFLYVETNSSTFGGGDVKWQVRFVVTCWQLWKRRCSLLLDEYYVEKEDIRVLCARLTDVYIAGSNDYMPSPLPTSAANLDNLEAVRILQHHFVALSDHALVFAIRQLVSHVWELEFKHIHRSANGVADGLARLAR